MTGADPGGRVALGPVVDDPPGRRVRAPAQAPGEETRVEDAVAGEGPRRPRRTRILLASCVAVAAVATAGAVVLAGRGGQEAPPGRGEAPATAPVTRGDLTASETLDGTLQYGDEVFLPNRLNGTVTWVAAPGTQVARGGVLYRLDEKPVVLLYGDVPAYRAFKEDMSDGGDVKELERNLAALGYSGFTVDEEFTENTAAAIKRWQKDLGLKKTGELELGRVLFAPQAVRAGQPDKKPGVEAQSGSPVLATTSAERSVTVKATMAQQQLLPQGGKVSVLLPGRDAPVPGKVTSVGTVVGGDGDGGDDDKDDGGDPKNDGDRTVTVRIALLDQKAAGALTYAPVRVRAESERRRGVLSVPVAALLALREGGHGVQVVGADGATRILPVTTGLFSGGRVEVSGAGVTEGLKVGIPAL
ncbi:peptidoglycan-binding domain-containing protein [Streptomyces solicathayae]|uniref:Peptidoglycan-binding domain-containing protein n=1 Tax=Streptomyces solicathayae TaxID=3081768 RepID=A0ABZ0LP17_9ACTN|nr:peptidoglycan-binding domain-containing protein [Streptomyces sp. HUAS YS2]WOX21244.1 peptidoglycan-binding domain-containing protein [Streptomyces sp. HUAS YS2]